jgi:hypothetical protein
MRKCQWSPTCMNQATSVLAHPFLGQVPICERCRRNAPVPLHLRH